MKSNPSLTRGTVHLLFHHWDNRCEVEDCIAGEWMRFDMSCDGVGATAQADPAVSISHDCIISCHLWLSSNKLLQTATERFLCCFAIHLQAARLICDFDGGILIPGCGILILPCLFRDGCRPADGLAVLVEKLDHAWSADIRVDHVQQRDA